MFRSRTISLARRILALAPLAALFLARSAFAQDEPPKLDTGNTAWILTSSALVLIWLSPTVQVDVLGRDDALFPLRNPALITIPLSFLAGVVGSLASQRLGAAETERFDERERQMLGA